MAVRLRDTLSGEVRPLEPLEPGHVRIYSCGPTVYGPAHIGNFRSFLFADLLVRHLRARGLRVTWVMNITDIDDKIIRGAAADGVTTEELAERWTARFLADADALGMTTPDVLPRATGHIPQIADLVATCSSATTRTGPMTARSSSGSPRGRRTASSPSSTRTRCASASGSRPTSTPRRRSATSRCGRVRSQASRRWETPIGPGRPGWHIECSAMSMAELGPSFDIHTGGIDLIFPHHEDEIAQSEAATGQPFVRTWLHCAHLRMGGEKMAKSTGNIARVADLLERGRPPGSSATR